MNPRLCCFLISLIFASFGSNAQVDVSRYTNKSVFEVKPIIQTKESVEDLVMVEGNTSHWEDEVKKAEVLMNERRYHDAVELYQRLADFYKSSSLPHYYTGLAYLEMDSLEASIKSFKKALLIEPLQTYYHYPLFLAYMNMREFKHAELELDKLSIVDEYKPLGYYGRGVLAAIEGNIYKSETAFERSVKEFPTFKDSYIPYGIIHFYLGGKRKAYEIFNKAVALDSVWEKAIILRGITSVIIEKNTAQFEKDIDKLLELDPSNYHYHSIRGFLQIELQNFPAAIDNFRNALNLSVDTTHRGAYSFSTKLRRSQDIQFALNYLEKRRSTINADDYLKICEILADYFKEEFQLALQKTYSSTSLTSYAITFVLRGIIQERSHNAEESIKNYGLAIKKDSAEYMFYKKRCELNIDYGRLDDGMLDANKMIQLDPKLKPAYKLKGIILFQKKNYVRSYQEFTKSIMLDSTDTDVYWNRGNAAFNIGYMDNAISDFREVVSERRKDADAYFMIANAFLRKADTTLSLNYIDTAISFNKFVPDYYLMQGTLHTSRKHTGKAIFSYSEALKKLPNYSKFLYLRGLEYRSMKALDLSLADLKTYVRITPDDPQGHYQLAQVYRDMNRPKDADRHFEKAKQLGYLEPEL